MDRNDIRLRWFESHISRALQTRSDDLKQLNTNEDNKRAIITLIKNEDVRRLYVYRNQSGKLWASNEPPIDLTGKAIFFIKHSVGKISAQDIDCQLSYFETSDNLLNHMHLMLREVYLPLLCGNDQYIKDQNAAIDNGSVGVNVDKLMELLHRLMSSVEVTDGQITGRVPLTLPSIEILAEAASMTNRRGAVLQILETTAVNWMKQIRTVLRFDPIREVFQRFGAEPVVLNDIFLWKEHEQFLYSITEQLNGPVALDILGNLERANSQYYHSFQTVLGDIEKEGEFTASLLRFLSPIETWFTKLHNSTSAEEIAQLFPPLLNLVFLLWENSSFHHDNKNLHHFLRLFANKVVHRALAIVGNDVMRDPFQSHSKLRDVLRICAGFRGAYIDTRDKANKQNQENVKENKEKIRLMPRGQLWNARVYGPYAYRPAYVRDGPSEEIRVDELLFDSPWPARNAECFDLLNTFMERCNDCMELVQTTQHFQMLSNTAEIGGAGSPSLDALVREIHLKYNAATEEFFLKVDNVLDMKNEKIFERAFFNFRTVVKDLERKLGNILHQGMHQCPTVLSQLRLLEVFEGINGRDVVHDILRDKDEMIVTNFMTELKLVHQMFHTQRDSPPPIPNVPPMVCSISWLHALKERIKVPMDKIKVISPHLLAGDAGFEIKNLYREIMEDVTKFLENKLKEWREYNTEDLTDCLKQPLLLVEEVVLPTGGSVQQLVVNLDPRLILLLNEIRHLLKPPFNVVLPPLAEKLMNTTELSRLRCMATRLEFITSKYNCALQTISKLEYTLLERQLVKIQQLLDQGLQTFTWRLAESSEFIERATILVCDDLAHTLNIVQSHTRDIEELTMRWGDPELDLFSLCHEDKSYSAEELQHFHRQVVENAENRIIPNGNKIHQLMESSLNAIQISKASPSWKEYVTHFDLIVYEGIRESVLISLTSIHNRIIKCNMNEEGEYTPIQTIRLELVDSRTLFLPPLEANCNSKSVQEYVTDWVSDYRERAKMVSMLQEQSGSDTMTETEPTGSYLEILECDEQVNLLIGHITETVENNALECATVAQLFKDYSFLWEQDIDHTFEDFLKGKISPNPFRTPSRSQYKHPNMFVSRRTSRISSSLSRVTIEEEDSAERSFLTPSNQSGISNNVPSLDEFNAEIDIYKTSRDELQSMPTNKDVGWLRVDLEPIKEVLITLASKWMWTYTRYLADQVGSMLRSLHNFLKQMEPEIESITGEEKDTVTFMRMMRLFNEVTSQQEEMENKFSAMERTIEILNKYGQELSEETKSLLDSAPNSWASMKTKLSLAKQRLGPKIHQEASTISNDLTEFQERIVSFQAELDRSEVFNPHSSIDSAHLMLDNFSKRLSIFENEAQDLRELQDLLDLKTVQFSILPKMRVDIENLKLVWETYLQINAEQREWKRHRWQRMNTKFLYEATQTQLEKVQELPEDVKSWELYTNLIECISNIQICLPLIDNLVNPAMRTRHWKQLVRITGVSMQVDSDSLRKMTLGELLSLGLQSHVEEVHGIVQRAIKDLDIEQSLKSYDEIWSSKQFNLIKHLRYSTKMRANSLTAGEGQESTGAMSERGERPSVQASRALNASRISSHSDFSRAGKSASQFSLPLSLAGIMEQQESVQEGDLFLLSRTENIFHQLEEHQTRLSEVAQSSAAGGFMDEVVKWQKTLQQIESVLVVWMEVQDNWMELEEIYQTPDVQSALHSDANKFQIANRDFRLLMKATEKNSNVLQCCSRKNISSILERTKAHLEKCKKSLYTYLDRRRSQFPWFYFLAPEDLLHIVGKSYDVNLLNDHIRILWENIGALLCHESPQQGGMQEIFGVRSVLNEPLYFRKAVLCEGPVEIWLSNTLTEITDTLRYQFASAMGNAKSELPVPSPTERGDSAPLSRNASAYSVRQSSSGAKKGGANLDSSSKTDKLSDTQQRRKRESIVDSYLVTKVMSEVLASTIEEDDSAQQTAPSEENETRSWLLNHVTEIVFLVYNIRFTAAVEEALNDGNVGDALEKCIETIETNQKVVQHLLKSLEHKEKLLQKASMRSKDSKVWATNSGANLSQAPGLKSDSSMDPSRKVLQASSGTMNFLEPAAAATTRDNAALSPSVPPTVKTNEQVTVQVTEEPDSHALREQLLPGQLHKARTVLAQLTEQRGILHDLNRLVKCGDVEATQGVWRSQLKFLFDEENSQVIVKSGDVELFYEFHYIGSAERLSLTTRTTQSTINIFNTVHNYKAALCCSDKGDLAHRVIREAAFLVGKPFYDFTCSMNMSSDLLSNIMRGAAITKSWVCLRDINRLNTSNQSISAQLTQQYLTSDSEGKQSVNLLGVEVPLVNPAYTTGAAILSTLDRVIDMNPTDHAFTFMERPIVFSSVTSVSLRLLDHFRVISVPPEEIDWLAHNRFTLEGFVMNSTLVPQLEDFLTIASSMIGCIVDKQTWTAEPSISGNQLRAIIKCSGRHLSKLKSSTLTHTPDDSSQESHLYELERRSVVYALEEHYLPYLTERQEKIFRLLLEDRFPNPTNQESERTLDDSTQRPVNSRSENNGSVNLSASNSVISEVKEESVKSIPIDNLISNAVKQLDLIMDQKLTSKTEQFFTLYEVNRTVTLIGPAGSGKSTLLKLARTVMRLNNHHVTTRRVNPGAVETVDFLGHFNIDQKMWQKGLLQKVIESFTYEVYDPTANVNKLIDNLLILDGPATTEQREAMTCVLHPADTMVFDNGEHLVLPPNLRVIWELESLQDLHPGLLTFVGIVCMEQEHSQWRILLDHWLKTKRGNEFESLEHWFGQYVPHVVDYVMKFTRDNQEDGGITSLKRLAPQTFANSIQLATTLIDGLLSNSTLHGMTASEYEMLVTYACLWGFGANMETRSRQHFSDWWKSKFHPSTSYPTEGNMFDYYIDLEKLEFLPWSDMIPAFTAQQNTGIAPDHMVFTPGFQSLAFNISLISDMARPLLLLGSPGVGKSSLIQDRVKTVCSSEVAECLNVTVRANRFTTSSLLAEAMDSKLEWKYGRTYIAKGNKRLVTFIDDLHLAHTDENNRQSATELVRQLIDSGGHYLPGTGEWRSLKLMSFMATSLTGFTSHSMKSQRFLRHFAVIAVNAALPHEQESIFSTLVQGHFLPSLDHANQNQPPTDERMIQRELEAILRKLLDQLVKVTVDLQERLSEMFQPVSQRGHYVFSLRTLSMIFRNLCHSLNSKSRHEMIFTLWRNECDWIYRERMVDRVDQDRYRRAYVTAVKKEFAEHYKLSDELLEILLKSKPSLCTNIALQESGLVSTKMHRSESDPDAQWGDGYTRAASVQKVRELIEESIDEYNKINPRILFPIYDSSVHYISRISRTLSTPHNLGHLCLVTEGNPSQAFLMVQLCAHLSNFKIALSSPISNKAEPKVILQKFKKDLINLYSNSGVRGEKTVFVIRDFEFYDPDVLVYLTEFIVFGEITRLFTHEDQTQIINSIRTEVTQSGLSYTREVAWNYFVNQVRHNVRVCLIISRTGQVFQSWCRHFPRLLSNMTFIWFQHWSKSSLIQQALHTMNHNLRGNSLLTALQKENLAHLLASMHLALRQQDGGEEGQSQYLHVNNTTYRMFVEKFCELVQQKCQDVRQEHKEAQSALEHIQQEAKLAHRLRKQLQHEKQVLDERQKGAYRILAQIGEDTAITESQMKVVKQQIDKIKRLKTLLPDYQLAHEKAVYKAIATVTSTKKLIQNLTADNLSELRGISKPLPDVEDIMAAVIMIMKSPNSDLTWQKGGKRQLANIERFIEELLTFDDQNMSEDTLVQVEDYLKRPGLNADQLTSQLDGSLPAALCLCQWVNGVARYQRIMMSRVRPLHSKVEATSKEVQLAEGKMKGLEVKRSQLEGRLGDLAKNFEEATIEKNNQDLKAESMNKMLSTASRLRRVMTGEYKKFQQIHNSLRERLVCIPGAAAIAAGFTTYFGPYTYGFRREMLSYHWPECLRERGIPLVFDSIDVVDGRVIDFSLFSYHWRPDRDGTSADSALQDFNSTGREETPIEEDTGRDANSVRTNSHHEPEEEEEEEEKDEEAGEENEEDDFFFEEEEDQEEEEKEDLAATPAEKDATNNEEAASDKLSKQSKSRLDDGEVSMKSIEDSHLDYGIEDDVELPQLTGPEYVKYFGALIAVLIGKKKFSEWSLKDLTLHEMMNAAIIRSSSNRPPLLIDPYGVGLSHLHWLIKSDSKEAKREKVVPIEVDMEFRWDDPQLLISLEEAIMQGRPLLLKNCSPQLDNLIEPLIHHTNMSCDQEESRMIRFGLRRILCHPGFRPLFVTEMENVHYTGDLTSVTVLVNYSVDKEGLAEDLVNRLFAQLSPELYHEKCLVSKHLQHWKEVMAIHSNQIRHLLTDSMDSNHMWSEDTMKLIGQAVDRLQNAYLQHNSTVSLLENLNQLRDKMIPLAGHAAVLHSTMQSLASIQSEYNFSLPFFLAIFDEAVGKMAEENASGELSEREKTLLSNRKSTVGRSPESSRDTEEDPEMEENVHTEEALPSLVEGEEEDKEFVSVVLSSRQAEERLKVMQEITGRRQVLRDASMIDLDQFLRKRGTLRSRALRFEEETQQSGVSRDRGMDNDHNLRRDQSLMVRRSELISRQAEKEGIVEGALPSSGVEYSSLSEEEADVIKEKILQIAFYKLRVSLFEEDILVFCLMLYLNPDLNLMGEMIATPEEMLYLVRGQNWVDMPVTLKYFNCDSNKPPWVADMLWNNLLNLSLLPGIMDSLCVHVAQNSDRWEEWFESESPESVLAPLLEEINQDSANKTDQQEKLPAEFSTRGFHQVLLVRILRPDRLKFALQNLFGSHFPFTGPCPPLKINEIKEYLTADLFKAVLVVTPKSPKEDHDHHLTNFPLPDPVTVLSDIALNEDIHCDHLVCSTVRTNELSSILDSAHQGDGWIILQDANLLPDTSLTVLSQYLDPKFSLAPTKTITESVEGDENDVEHRPIIWITVQAGSDFSNRLPQRIVNQLFPISSRSITDSLLIESTTDDSGDSTDDKEVHTDYVKSAILSSFQIQSLQLLEALLTDSWRRTAYSCFCICNSIIFLRQSMGSRGMSVWKYLSQETYQTALSTILNCETVDTVELAVRKVVYDEILIHAIDRKFVHALLSRMYRSVIDNSLSVNLPDNFVMNIPPASIAYPTMSDWLKTQSWACDNQLALITQLEDNVIKEFLSTRTSSLMKSLSRMQGKSSSPIPSILPNPGSDTGNLPLMTSSELDMQKVQRGDLSAVKMRTVLDYLEDNLPPLIEPHNLVDEVGFLLLSSKFRQKGSQTLPLTRNERPDIEMFTKAAQSTKIIPECLSHVLHEECCIYNLEMLSIRRSISQLSNYVAAGEQGIPDYWLTAALSLQREMLPVDWLKGDRQFTNHNLCSWIKYQSRRWSQLNHWMRLGVTSGEKKEGLPQSVWLGGFYHPEMFLSALTHEKAMAESCSIREVKFVLELTDSSRAVPFNIQEDVAFFVTGAYSCGACQDDSNSLIISTKQSMNQLPTFLLKVVTDSEMDTSNNYFDCPVYINQARQTLIADFKVPAACSIEELCLRSVSLVLDPGCTEGNPLAPRIPIVSQRQLSPRGLLLSMPSVHTEGMAPATSDHLSQDSRLEPLPEVDEEKSVAVSTPGKQEVGQSSREDASVPRSESSEHRSQMSFKESSPNAQELPPNLHLERQQPITSQRTDSEAEETSQRDSQPQSETRESDPPSVRSNGEEDTMTHDEEEATDTERTVTQEEDQTTREEEEEEETRETDRSVQSTEPESQESYTPPRRGSGGGGGGSHTFEPQHSTIYEEKTRTSLDQPNGDPPADTVENDTTRSDEPGDSSGSPGQGDTMRSEEEEEVDERTETPVRKNSPEAEKISKTTKKTMSESNPSLSRTQQSQPVSTEENSPSKRSDPEQHSSNRSLQSLTKKDSNRSPASLTNRSRDSSKRSLEFTFSNSQQSLTNNKQPAAAGSRASVNSDPNRRAEQPTNQRTSRGSLRSNQN